jgi:hypothetical protein
MVATEKPRIHALRAKLAQAVNDLSRIGPPIDVVTEKNQKRLMFIFRRLFQHGFKQSSQQILAAMNIADGIDTAVVQCPESLSLSTNKPIPPGPQQHFPEIIML